MTVAIGPKSSESNSQAHARRFFNWPRFALINASVPQPTANSESEGTLPG